MMGSGRNYLVGTVQDSAYGRCGGVRLATEDMQLQRLLRVT